MSTTAMRTFRPSSRNATLERWLNKEVMPVYDAMKADSKRAIPVENDFTTIREHHAARMKAAKR
jgi:antitoxin ParD1/3/4